MGEPIIFVGLDVHKGTITVALAEEGRRSEVREYGRIANTPADLQKLLDKLARAGRTLRFCYEAGPCGYGIQRQVTAAGHECVVVAPSLIRASQVSASRPTGATPAIWPGCIGPANSPPSGFRIQPMKPCATWFGPVWLQCGRCAKPVSNSQAFSCAMGDITTDRPGP